MNGNSHWSWVLSRVCIALVAAVAMSGCKAYEKKQQAGAAVEVNGHYLYRSTLDSMTVSMGAEDSLRTVQQYISQWAKDELVYGESQQSLTMKGGRKQEIDRMVEDYRRALYVQAYEQLLVERRMPKNVPDSVVSRVYEQMPDRFVLDESIVKGMLVVVPNEARDIAKLRGWMAKGSMDEIEKYVYKSASGYELFDDRWVRTSGLMSKIPMERAALETALKNKDQIEVSDSLKTYILQVTEKELAGERMPVDFARPEIEKMVLNARQVEFLHKERERMYNEAIRDKKVNFF